MRFSRMAQALGGFLDSSGVRRYVAVLVDSSERVIRYLCTCRAHVHAPDTAGYAMPYGFAWAWCPSIEATDHEWTPIKDMRSRMADLADVLDVLRRNAAFGA